ncbi:fibronectin type III domain-containing protein [Agromyces italicus]|uniref:fibronectin type III domain-containing protein n=1 Tax=Agromyces italicus TaxID=279572 RepID=UPI00041087EB|nr:fibronectin type III domain-containing protein [Agromyces italicus]
MRSDVSPRDIRSKLGRALRRLTLATALTALLAGGGVVAAANAAGESTVTGRVVNSGGAPVAGVKLTTGANQGDAGDAAPRSTVTAADGSFTLTTAIPYRFYVRVEAPAPYVSSSTIAVDGGLAWGEWHDGSRRFDPGSTNEVGTLTLDPGIEVGGALGVSGLGGPQEARVRVQAADAREVAGSFDVSNGSTPWKLRVPAGSYTVKGSVWAAGLDASQTVPITVGTASLTGIDLAFAANGRTIAGTVLDPDGKAASGVHLTLSPIDPANSGDYRGMNVGVNGRYLLENIRNGSYRVQVDTGDGTRWIKGNGVTMSYEDAEILVFEQASPSRTISFTAARAASSEPRSVVATAGNASATVTWQAPLSEGNSEIDEYRVTASPGGKSVVVIAPTLTAKVPGLTNGTVYTFTVDASNGWGVSLPSVASAPVTPATVPGAPTGVSAVAGNGNATVSWKAPASNGGSAITGYTVTSSPGGKTATVSGSATTATVAGLTNGTAYTFTVKAQNAKGSSVASAASAAVTPATVPGAPTGVSAVAGSGKATVSWVAPASNGGSAITGYTVTSSPGGKTATVAGSATTATVSGLANGTAYTFTVKATNAKGSSAASSASGAVTPATVPDAPTAVSAVAGNAEATVSVAPASNGGSAITGYTVTSSPGGKMATVAGSATTATVSGLANGTAYTFTVKATNAKGSSAASSASGAVTPATVPDAPTAVSAVAGNAEATVSWAVASTGGSPVTGYTVTSSPGGKTATVSGSATTATVTGLANGTAYTFTVKATNAKGTSGASDASAAVTPVGAPDAPTGVTADAADARAIVSWTAPGFTGGSAITGYTVTSSPGGKTATVSGSTKTATVSGLVNGTAYTFTVKARNVVGSSVASSPSTAVTPKSATDRYAGASRYDTAAVVSRKSFAPGVDTVYVAGGTGLADALAGASVAGRDAAPILLTAATSLPAQTKLELQRLDPKKVVILGGTGVVAKSLETAIARAAGVTSVTRLAGVNRYETAAGISRASFEAGVSTVYLANGTGLPDALAGAPVAGSVGGPVLLVEKSRIPKETAVELKRLKPAKIVILGGTGVVSSTVVSQVKSLVNPTKGVTRWAGTDRYATAAAIVAKAFPSGASTVYVAQGDGLPDALAAAPVAAVDGAPILLVGRDSIPSATALALEALDSEKPITRIVVLGGTGVVSDKVRVALAKYTG